MPGTAVAQQLQLGDHVCWRFDDEGHLLDAMAEVVTAGVAENHKIVYYTEAVTSGAVHAGLAARGVRVEQARDGQLRVLPASPAYLSRGRFDPRAVLGNLAALAAQAASEGYRGLRFVADMAWALADPAGTRELQWYESQANRLFLDGRTLAVCLYDRRAFDAHALREIICAHPATVPLSPEATGTAWVPLLRIQRTAEPYGLRLTGEADLTNRHALATAVDAALDGLPRPPVPLVVDLAGLRFADAATGGLLIRAACAAPAGLHLVGCHGVVATLLDCLGLARLPGVQIAGGHDGPEGER